MPLRNSFSVMIAAGTFVPVLCTWINKKDVGQDIMQTAQNRPAILGTFVGVVHH